MLISAAATVFLGTFYPLFIDLLGHDKISVGPPFYARTFVPIMVPLLIAMVVGPALKWKRDVLKPQISRLGLALTAAVLTMAIVAAATMGNHILSALGLGLSLWIIVGSLLMVVHRTRLGAG